MSMRCSGKVAVVAGGTGALGRAVSLALQQEGAQVVVTYRKPEEFDPLRNAVPAGGSRLEGHRIDVTEETAVSELIAKVVAQHAALDVLVNTVGGYAGGTKLWELEANVLDRMLAQNLRSGYVLSRAAVRVMLKQGRGTIVNVAAKAALDHPCGAAAYAASKAAALALLDSLGAELKGTGVRVNSILPSIIDTQANRQAMPKADFSKWPKPEEIARVILFLCSDEAAVVHAAAIPVYGQS